MLKKRTYKIVGLTPLLMHNVRLANPFDEYTKAISKITSKNKKTEEDFEELAKLEFFGGLYLDEKSRPIIPDVMLEGLIIAGAKKFRQGKEAKAAVTVLESALLIYDGEQDVKKRIIGYDPAYVNQTMVVVSRSKVLRTRPIFRNWSLEFAAIFDSDLVDADDLDKWMEAAGVTCCLGDWRPKHGRFEVASAS